MGEKFRTAFKVGGPVPDLRKWFPRHMYVGLQKMQAKLRNVDCVIEVHDCRLPLSGRNLNFQKELYAIKPHILVMNKKDLISKSERIGVETVMKKHSGAKTVLWTRLDARKSQDVNRILRAVLNEVENFPRFHRVYKSEYQAMVIGVPNVGKSTLINALRREFTEKSRDATRVGSTPGITRHVLEKIRIHHDPKIYVLDTPGVMSPDIRDVETGLKMALCQLVKESLVDQQMLADYLLYFCNKNENFRYVKEMRLKDGPTDSILSLLTQVAENFRLSRQASMPGEGVVTTMDLEKAAHKFISGFRGGRFGSQFMDHQLLSDEEFGSTTNRREIIGL